MDVKRDVVIILLIFSPQMLIKIVESESKYGNSIFNSNGSK